MQAILASFDGSSRSARGGLVIANHTRALYRGGLRGYTLRYTTGDHIAALNVHAICRLTRLYFQCSSQEIPGTVVDRPGRYIVARGDCATTRTVDRRVSRAWIQHDYLTSFHDGRRVYRTHAVGANGQGNDYADLHRNRRLSSLTHEGLTHILPRKATVSRARITSSNTSDWTTQCSQAERDAA